MIQLREKRSRSLWHFGWFNGGCSVVGRGKTWLTMKALLVERGLNSTGTEMGWENSICSLLFFFVKMEFERYNISNCSSFRSLTEEKLEMVAFHNTSALSGVFTLFLKRTQWVSKKNPNTSSKKNIHCATVMRKETRINNVCGMKNKTNRFQDECRTLLHTRWK